MKIDGRSEMESQRQVKGVVIYFQFLRDFILIISNISHFGGFQVDRSLRAVTRMRRNNGLYEILKVFKIIT